MSNEYRTIPMLALRGLTIFPYMVLHFDVGRDKSIAALEKAMLDNQEIFLVAQKDSTIQEPEEDDIFEIGTVAKVKQMLKLPGETIRVLVEGLKRGRINEYVQTDPFFEVSIEESSVDEEKHTDNDIEIKNLEIEALMRRVLDVFEKYVRLSNRISPDTMVSVSSVTEPGQFADVIAANLLGKQKDKQAILETFLSTERLKKLYKILLDEIQILEIEKQIHTQVKDQIDKMQREYYLREQIKIIRQELGEHADVGEEVDEYRDAIEAADLPEEVLEKAEKELGRLSKMAPTSPEGSVIRTYLDWILELPWNETTVDNMNLKRAAKILDEDHYGLEKVKERIIEYLAVRSLTKNMKGPILCFVGPPGVGKTSIARSIARAIDRKFVRMSLGGVRDEAEIRGHRRTYIGSIPGRIISSMKLAGTKNPVFLLDEIDKMSSDFRGDPASAMLEVLDSEQNFAFRDHYMELPFDLSKVLFITTANTMDTIPGPLLDRMEVIRIAGYTEDEKYNIANKYLLPKQLKEHGLTKGSVIIPKAVIYDIIALYTREAGVRNLERELANACRKAARRLIEEDRKRIRLSQVNLHKFLGIPRYHVDEADIKDEVGMVTGLAWTAVGGVTLPVEVACIPGSGKLSLTGHLGEVMKESAQAALSYIRSKSDELNLDKDFYKTLDIHIHIPEGAIPKDGPSAGITMATAMISALTGIPVKGDLAMTGEITLRGRVLPIGGLKEKVLAAHRAGIANVLIPSDNRKNIEEIPANILETVKVTPINHMDQVISNALIRPPNAQA